MDELREVVTEFEPKLSPEEYKKVLDGLELIDIELTECTMESKPKVSSTSSQRKVTINSKASFGIQDEKTVVNRITYRLRGKEGRVVIFKLDATYHVNMRSEEQFTPEFFEVYEHLTLRLQTWPYFRELTGSLTSRSSLPQLTLPLLKNSMHD